VCENKPPERGGGWPNVGYLTGHANAKRNVSKIGVAGLFRIRKVQATGGAMLVIQVCIAQRKQRVQECPGANYRYDRQGNVGLQMNRVEVLHRIEEKDHRKEAGNGGGNSEGKNQNPAGILNAVGLPGFVRQQVRHGYPGQYVGRKRVTNVHQQYLNGPDNQPATDKVGDQGNAQTNGEPVVSI